MTVEVIPFEAGLGADIRGVDIAKPISPIDRDRLIGAWHDHLVLRVREQPLTDAELMAFTRNFGELDFPAAKKSEKELGVTVFNKDIDETVPREIQVISNLLRDGKPLGALGDGEAAWHTDSSFFEIPPAGSFLHAIEVPLEGGNTHFCNMYAAYDTLPEALKSRIADLSAIHSITHNSAGKPAKGYENFTDVVNAPGARHPLIRTHPDTGRKCLFLGRRTNSYVIGLSVEESESLLDTLWAHTIQPQFTWGQDWHPGDLVIWDNRCAMHRRDAFDPNARRMMHRTQIKGTRPV